MSTALEDAAAARKEKLLALRKRKAQGQTDSESTDAFKFRNYDPETGQAKVHAPVDEQDTVEQDVRGLAEKVLEEDRQRREQELDLTSIQPKRPNWDLKRDLDARLARLEPKTEAAIAQLIRDRIRAERGKSEDSSAAANLANAIESRNIEDSESGSDTE